MTVLSLSLHHLFSIKLTSSLSGSFVGSVLGSNLACLPPPNSGTHYRADYLTVHFATREGSLWWSWFLSYLSTLWQILHLWLSAQIFALRESNGWNVRKEHTEHASFWFNNLRFKQNRRLHSWLHMICLYRCMNKGQGPWFHLIH